LQCSYRLHCLAADCSRGFGDGACEHFRPTKRGSRCRWAALFAFRSPRPRADQAFGMTSNSQTAALGAPGWKRYVSRTAITLFATVAVYVLSFGPIFNLTTTKIGKGYIRPARFPNWADTVNTLYSPLVHILAGHPQGDAIQGSRVVCSPVWL
jgi:hypothetical protein